MTIRIDAQILSGNLGDGWKDEYEAANGYAVFLESRIREKISGWYPAAEIIVNIDVQRASGASRPAVVLVDTENAYEIENELENELEAIGSKAFTDWCTSGDANEYIVE